MQNRDKYPDLEPFVKGSSYKQLFDWFYKLALIRYATKNHLNAFNNKFGTKAKLNSFFHFQYVHRIGDFYHPTEKSLQVLTAEGYNLDIITRPSGESNVEAHQRAVSEVVFTAMQDEHFYSVFYTDFSWMKPDACIVYKKDGAYRIEFLEVEVSPKHSGYIPGKDKNYERLASDYETYSVWWKTWADRLGLPYCTAEQFKFTVRVEPVRS